MSTPFDFATFPILTTERLSLRALRPNDAEALMALYSDPQVLRFLNLAPTDSAEKALGLINWFNDLFEQQIGVQWAFTQSGEDRLIGTGGAYGWDRDNRRVDIGYHILPALWGRGYATEAARAVVQWCFDHLDVHRVQADCTEGNIASERVMLKCGFTHEGTWRESCWEHGRFVNIKQFGLLRREWTAVNGTVELDNPTPLPRLL
jgi:ribosomal-protein-alanine N-acetyltransferase